MDFEAATATLQAVLWDVCGPKRDKPNVEILTTIGTADTKAINKMEKFWIGTLHKAFEAAMPTSTVFSKVCHDAPWDRYEFLHDIAVMTRRFVKSPFQNVDIPIVEKIFWQVESELSGDGRKVGIDFSKLVAGSAESKLLMVCLPVERQVDGLSKVSTFVHDIGFGCEGNFFLAFVPYYALRHPHLETYWRKPGPLPVALFGRSAGGTMDRIDLPWLPSELVPK
jgi:hypothetical protein